MPHSAASHRRGNILTTTTFRSLGILAETAEALEAVGIMTPFPIQEMTLPVALAGNDVIGQAKTGTGKTLGFGLPLLERVTVPADVEAGRATPEQLTDAPQALVVVPTRELCQQVTNDLLTAGKVRAVRVLAIYGGRAYEPQVEALKKGVDVIVGTPGRLLDLAGQKKLDLKHVRALVLDEADEMLDLGFLPDVEKIMGMLPAKRQTMLFSATMPGAVINLARRYMSQPTHISATSPDDENATVANTTQHVFRAHSLDKVELVSRILQADGRGLAMIFCRTKRTAADVAEQLEKRGFASGAVHGDLGQGAREQALRAFRNGKVDVLVCTDVAARGIDVEGVTHVVNYQTPEDEKTYLHRIGRTGRAGASGTAITLVDWDDIPRWQLINKALDLSFNDPEETYSTSAHLYELLGIPEGTKGILPRAERTRAGLDAEEVEDLGETGGRGARGRRPAGGSGSGRQAAAPVEERPARTRTPRQRRRTRGGETLTAEQSAAAESAVAVSAPAEAAEGEQGVRTPRRRRRTRTSAAVTPETVTPEAVTEAVVEAAAPAPVAPVDEAPKAPRRRTRKSAAAAPADAPVTPVADVKPVADEAPAVEESPKRRRTRKAAAPVETVEAAVPAPAVPADTEEAPKAPRRRTRKAAAEVPAPAAEPVAEAAAEAAPKTPRRRTRKVAAPAETVDAG
ncbi:MULTISPECIES: DEAD/DEAH box helicase [unclassified Streptomyces]|uniref:DEAD/DEAH box helicase n=1 Tax=unclassified Streptomyces TaxID=2593676 RepID=UPI002E295C07|nr:DEAD/DEAH box helicase [Streptomyces sp. NBC_00223]